MRAWGVVALVIAGCAPATVPIDELDGRLARADCEREVRCGRFDTVERCLTFTPAHAPITPSIAAAVAAGLVDYDAEQAAECVDERAAVSCAHADASWRLVDDSSLCRGVLRAGRKIGDPCAIDAECSTRRCHLDCQPGTCCEGVCVNAEQESSLGEDCTTHRCGPNLWCSDTAICYPLLTRGLPCPSTSACDFGLDCFDTCQPALHDGDPCGMRGGTPTCGAVDGLVCDEATMTCTPALGLGDRCSPFAPQCQLGWLHCDPQTSTCRPFARVGEPCTLPYSDCEGGAFCARAGELDLGVCLPLVDDGSPCEYDSQCASGSCQGDPPMCVEPPVCT